MKYRECLRTSTNVWRSLCDPGDHFAIIANLWRMAFVSPFSIHSPLVRPALHSKHHNNDRDCLRTDTNGWRSFAIITNSWRTAFVSTFAIYSPQCESSITDDFQRSYCGGLGLRVVVRIIALVLFMVRVMVGVRVIMVLRSG